MRRLTIWLAVIFATLSLGMAACKQTTNTIDVYAPDGAPALALGLLMSEDTAEDNVEYHVVSSATIQTYVTGNQPKADVCVLPVNLAAKLLGDGSSYKMAGVVTHGNMYMIAKEANSYTRENASALIGKTVGVVQLANVPGLTLKMALSSLEIPYNDLSNGAEERVDAVNLKPVDVKSLLGADLYLLPSPAADKRVENAGFSFVGSLQELYGGDRGYPQAVVVVKNELLNDGSEWVRGFVEKLALGDEWLKTTNQSLVAGTVAKYIEEGLTPTFTAENLTQSAIAHSGVWFQAMDNAAVEEVEQFLTRMVAIDDQKASVPNKQFYWNAL